jgi:hypothetical protein
MTTVVTDLNSLGVDGACLLQAKEYFDAVADGTLGKYNYTVYYRYVENT